MPLLKRQGHFIMQKGGGRIIIINYVIIFALNVFATCLGNLKTTFLAQKAIKPVYVTTFIDAIVFVYAFKLVTSSNGYGYILSYALGKLLGVFLANIIEKTLAIGQLEIEVYKHPVEGKTLADSLR